MIVFFRRAIFCCCVLADIFVGDLIVDMLQTNCLYRVFLPACSG